MEVFSVPLPCAPWLRGGRPAMPALVVLLAPLPMRPLSVRLRWLGFGCGVILPSATLLLLLWPGFSACLRMLRPVTMRLLLLMMLAVLMLLSVLYVLSVWALPVVLVGVGPDSAG